MNAAPPENINAIKINTGLKQISFYTIENDVFEFEGSVSYLTDTEIYALIFSDSLDFYKCNMQKAFNRFHLITTVLSGRSNEIKNNPETPARCQGLFNIQNNGLYNIQLESKIFSDISGNELTTSINSLRNANRQTQESSCALIY